MPAAVIAGLLAPLGLAAPAFWVMNLGIEYILQVAAFIAGLDNAQRGVLSGPPVSLALIGLGGLFMVLWLGRPRFFGVVPMLLGVFIWAQQDRPDILISENGRLFGVRTAQGLVVNSETGNGFSAESWLENDGDLAEQATAFARPGMERSKGRAVMEVAGLGRFVYYGSKKAGDLADAACDEAAIMLAPSLRDAPGGRCLFIGAERLGHDGALAIRIRDGRPIIEGAKSANQGRPWTRDHRAGF
jgi:competence protein ComEC